MISDITTRSLISIIDEKVKHFKFLLSQKRTLKNLILLPIDILYIAGSILFAIVFILIFILINFVVLFFIISKDKIYDHFKR